MTILIIILLAYYKTQIQRIIPFSPKISLENVGILDADNLWFIKKLKIAVCLVFKACNLIKEILIELQYNECNLVYIGSNVYLINALESNLGIYLRNNDSYDWLDLIFSFLIYFPSISRMINTEQKAI